MEIEYEITTEDLYAAQLRAFQKSKSVKRSKRQSYIYLFLAVFLFSIVPWIGSGFVISLANLTSFVFNLTMFLAMVLPISFLLNWIHYRRASKRAIREYISQIKPNKGVLGKTQGGLD